MFEGAQLTLAAKVLCYLRIRRRHRRRPGPQPLRGRAGRRLRRGLLGGVLRRCTKRRRRRRAAARALHGQDERQMRCIHRCTKPSGGWVATKRDKGMYVIL